MRLYSHMLPVVLAVLPFALTQSPSASPTSTGAITAAPTTPSTTSASTTSSSTTFSTTISSSTTSSAGQTTTTISSSTPSAGTNSTSISGTASSGNTSITVSGSTSVNVSITSTSLSPNATTTAISNATVPVIGDESDEWLGPDGDEIPPPAAFQADEQVFNLVYAANYDKAGCQALAQSYASGSSAMVRRHWAEVAYKRKRQTLSGKPHRCLPAVYTIPVTFHWLPPKGVTVSKWVNTASLTATILATQNKLGIMNAALDVRSRFVWDQSDNTDRFSKNTKEDIDWSRSFIRALKIKKGSNQYSHLNVFIVHEAGPGINGFATFPGVNGGKAEYAAVVLSSHTLLGNKNGKFDATKNLYHGTTMAHEIGHWLGLRHPHHGGCSGDDFERETPQYPAGWGDYTCPDSKGKAAYVGTRGADERNIMAYSDGRSIAQGTFGRDQARRAAAGYTMRRSGVGSGGSLDDSKWYTKKCVNRYRRDLAALEARQFNGTFDDAAERSIIVPRDLHPLNRRQLASQLTSFCNSADLTVENYEFSDLSKAGLYSENSPSIPNQPPTVQSQVQAVTPPSDATEQGGATPNSFTQVQQAVEQRVERNGGAIVDGAAPPVPTEVTKQLDEARNSGSGGTGTSGTRSAAKEVVTVTKFGFSALILAAVSGLLTIF